MHPLEDFPDWQHDALRIARDVVETDHYLPLPDRFEIHEYQITEHHGDLFPFAFEGAPGGQNFLGKVFGCVGQGFAFVVSGCSSDGIWGESRGR
jgi:hypothetical protein